MCLPPPNTGVPLFSHHAWVPVHPSSPSLRDSASFTAPAACLAEKRVAVKRHG